MIGKALRDHRAEHPLDFEIDLGDQVDGAFFFDTDAGAELGDLEIAGAHDRFDRGGEECGSAVRRRPWRRGSRARFLELLDHPNLHAARHFLQHRFVHEVANEEDPAAAGLEDVFGRQRVGHFFRHEALALVFDANHQFVAGASAGTGLNSTITRLSGSFLLPCLMALTTDSRTATLTQWS